MIRTLFFTLAVAAAARAQLSAPQIGFVEDGAQAVHPLYGIAGNFILGKAAPGTAVSFASSGSFELLKTDSAVIALGRLGQMVASMNAPAGPALFAFAPNGAPALAYLAATNELFRWSAAGLQAVALGQTSLGDGTVLSIASPDAAHAAFILQRADGVWDIRVLLATGEVDSESALTGVTAPAFMLSSGDIVYAIGLRRGRLSTQSVVIRRTDGSEIQLPAELPAGFSFEQMGDAWVQIRGLGGAAQFAIRATPGLEGVYRLPEVER
jgi:hypothetical protein